LNEIEGYGKLHAMPRPRTFENSQLRALLSEGLTVDQAAERLGVSRTAVVKRLAILDRNVCAMGPQHAERAVASMWDTKAAADQNYHRTLQLLEDPDADQKDKLRAVKEIRQHLALGVQVLDTLYNVHDVRAFVEEVLTIIEEVEPDARERIFANIRAKRTLRAAGLDGIWQDVRARSTNALTFAPFSGTQ
jgi:hypothetical protein